jgi:hypothetical protein
MRHWDWSLFAAFVVSLTVIGFGLACLLWAENNQHDSFGWTTTRKSRHLRILGWIAICAGIPLVLILVEAWLETVRFAD